MSTALTLGVEAPVTLATTTELLTGTGPDFGGVLHILESDVDVYVVTSDVADGGALPSTGRQLFETASLPVSVPVRGYGQLSLAGSGAGTARVVLR